MARADITAVQVTTAGAAQAATVGAADGHMFINTGVERVRVENINGAAARDVTFVTPGTVDGDLAVADRTVSIPANGIRMFGPFPKRPYNQIAGADAGKVYVDPDSGTPTDIKIEVWKG